MLCEELDSIHGNFEGYTMKEFEETVFYKIRIVLLNYLKELAYYLFGFKIEEMTPTIRKLYKSKLDREKLLLKEFKIE